jgi:hypothetical protein
VWDHISGFLIGSREKELLSTRNSSIPQDNSSNLHTSTVRMRLPSGRKPTAAKVLGMTNLGQSPENRAHFRPIDFVIIALIAIGIVSFGGPIGLCYYTRDIAFARSFHPLFHNVVRNNSNNIHVFTILPSHGQDAKHYWLLGDGRYHHNVL